MPNGRLERQLEPQARTEGSDRLPAPSTGQLKKPAHEHLLARLDRELVSIPNPITRWYLFLALAGGLVFVAAGIGVEIIARGDLDSDLRETARAILSHESERSVSSWFSTLQLAFAAVLLGFVGVAEYRESRTPNMWLVASVLFMLLSFDEAVSIHERFNATLGDDPDNPVELVWFTVFTGAIGCLLMFRWWTALPAETKVWTGVGMAVFFAGVVVVEILGGELYTIGGPQSNLYIVVSGLEELCEMAGISIFVTGLLIYGHRVGSWQNSFVKRPGAGLAHSASRAQATTDRAYQPQRSPAPK